MIRITIHFVMFLMNRLSSLIRAKQCRCVADTKRQLMLAGLVGVGMFLPLCTYSEEMLVKLSLYEVPVDTVVIDEVPPVGLPQTFPFVAGMNAGSRVTVVEEYLTKEGALGDGETKVLLIKKIGENEPFGVRFHFPGARMSSGKLKLDIKGIFDANDQRGNIVIGFAGENGLISYIQVGESGVIQLIQTGKESAVLDLESIPMSAVIESLALELDFETETASVLVNGRTIGIGSFDNSSAVSAVTLNIGGAPEARRTLAIEDLRVSFRE